MTSWFRRLARATGAEHGFSMVVTMGAVSMLLLSTMISLTSLDNDQPLAAADTDRKSAIAAAEAGLQVYVHKLTVDNTYWANCKVPADAVNDFWPGKSPSADPRVWKNINGEKDPDTGVVSPVSAYTIEMLPNAKGQLCNPSDPDSTVIDADTATFRIRVTGSAVVDGKRDGPRRALIATFKRKSFLDFIYFTDLEVTDPATYQNTYADGAVTKEDPGRNPYNATYQRSLTEWGNQACSTKAYEPEVKTGKYRDKQLFDGHKSNKAGKLTSSGWEDFDLDCKEIRFVAGDSIAGPLHTNDSLMVCGNPAFGRNQDDIIETSHPGPTAGQSYRKDPDCGSGSAPDVNFPPSTAKNNRGTWAFKQPILELPPSNGSLASEAEAQYTFAGETKLKLAGTSITITSGTLANGTVMDGKTVPFPSSGVVYVGSRTDTSQGPLCSGEYNVGDPYNANRDGCAVAYVSGTYSKGLTITAEADVIINGNITKAAKSPALLGLIAKDFVRVYHPVTAVDCKASTPNGAGALKDPIIHAAILSLTHSFIVDNYLCGPPLGDLTVLGAIAQKYRGPVGLGSKGVASTGYIKRYTHDDALRYRAPPKFLDPVKAAWRVKTFQEQVPAY